MTKPWTRADLDQFAELSDEVVESRRQSAIDDFKNGTGADGARAIALLEAETVRRAGVREFGENPVDLAFITVGGQADAPLFAALALPARYYVLLHSSTPAGKRSAEACAERFALSAAHGALRPIGNGRDVAPLYRVLMDMWKERGKPDRVYVDFTGGYKPMTAGAAAAAFAIPGAKASYVESDQDRGPGGANGFWVNERRVDIDNPYEVFGELDRDRARELIRLGSWTAAAAVLARVTERTGRLGDRVAQEVCTACSDIGALGFGKARAALDRGLAEMRRYLDQAREDHHRLTPALAAVGALREGAHALFEFSERVKSVGNPEMAVSALDSPSFPDFVAFLVASAERQIEAGQHDIASLQTYRACEAMVQRRLFKRHGVDPSAVDWAAQAAKPGRTPDAFVKAYNAVAGPKHELPSDLTTMDTRVSRCSAYCLLTALGEDDLATRSGFKAFESDSQSRNNSIMGHGFAQVSEKTARATLAYSKELFQEFLRHEGFTASESDALRGRHRFPSLEALDLVLAMG